MHELHVKQSILLHAGWGENMDTKVHSFVRKKHLQQLHKLASMRAARRAGQSCVKKLRCPQVVSVYTCSVGVYRGLHSDSTLHAPRCPALRAAHECTVDTDRMSVC